MINIQKLIVFLSIINKQSNNKINKMSPFAKNIFVKRGGGRKTRRGAGERNFL